MQSFPKPIQEEPSDEIDKVTSNSINEAQNQKIKNIKRFKNASENCDETDSCSDDIVSSGAASLEQGSGADEYYTPSCNSVVFSLKNQVGGLAKALHVFKVLLLFSHKYVNTDSF